jgi:WD40 repeat protein
MSVPLWQPHFLSKNLLTTSFGCLEMSGTISAHLRLAMSENLSSSLANPPMLRERIKFEQALSVANAAVMAEFDRHLNDVETTILRGAWENQTYIQIAEISGYSVSYLTRDVGPKLWKLLTQALAEGVSKTNFRVALERRWLSVANHPQGLALSIEERREPELVPLVRLPKPAAVVNLRQDWGEATDVSLFYGRKNELERLEQWIGQDRCRLVVLLGMGGIGKTSLSVKLAQQVQGQFDYVIWRSLRNAPPLKTWLSDLIGFLSEQHDAGTEFTQLIYWLRRSRCLIVLDNVETILQAGCTGEYCAGYEDYGELFRLMGETSHQSCLVLTSREKPAEIATLEGDNFAVRSWQLTGSMEAAQALLVAKGLTGTFEEKQLLCERYSCNPLALKIVATCIQDLFDGKISEFLAQDATIFRGIYKLLDQQFQRCSSLEKTIMYWLAINREWTSIAELAADILPAVSKSELLEALESLQWRSLLEKQSSRYTQQPVVMEYITDCINKQICQEIIQGNLSILKSHALLKISGKDYIKETQIRQILQPILRSLITQLDTQKNIEIQLFSLLKEIQEKPKPEPNYAAGNLFNLLAQIQPNLSQFDFSNLVLWHADLQKVHLQNCNFSSTDLSRSHFIETIGTPLSLAFSPDGHLLATGDGNSEVILWHVKTGKKLLTYQGHTHWIWSVSFSPDSSKLASGSDDKTIRIWDIKTGECLQILQGHDSHVWSVAWSQDGQTLASGSEDQTIKLWNLHTGICYQTLQGHNSWVRSVAFSPDGTRLASGADDQTVRLWDLHTGQCQHILHEHSKRVWSVAWSPNGQTLISGSSDHTVKVWDVQTGICQQTLRGHHNWVRAVAISRDDYTIASGSEDKTIKLWDLRTGECRQTLQGHSSWVRSVAFHVGGEILASGSGDHTIKFWDVQSGRCDKTLQGYTNRVWSVAISPNGQILASGNDDHTVKLWNLQTQSCEQILQGHHNSVCCVAWSSDGKTLASGSSDHTVRVWEAKTGLCRHILKGHTSRIWSVAFSPDGKILASSSEDQTVKIWDLETGMCQQTLRGHSNWVCAVTVAKIGTDETVVLISAGYDQMLKVWDIHTGECRQTWQAHDNWVWTVAASPDQSLLASGSGDHTIKLWNLNQSRCQQTLEGHSSRVWSVAWSPDSQMLASGSSDQTVKIWDIKTGHCLQTLEGHTNLIWSVAWSPDGSIIASGSQDETIKLWDAKTGHCLTTLKAPRPYEGMNIAGVVGLMPAQKVTLKTLGAVEL